MKREKSNSKLESKNAFIIKHFQNNKHNDDSLDITCFDQRRAVFISLFGLYRTWKQCPSIVLYTAIFLLPIKTDWIYHPRKYRNRKSKQYPHHEMQELFLNLADIDEFIDVLKWKDSQRLLFCTLDDEPHSIPTVTPSDDSLIHPFWHYLSTQLSNTYDAVTQKQCNPIVMDSKWWCGAQWKSKYDVKSASVLCELYFGTIKYKTVQEIIYQSNPKSLCPIIAYDRTTYKDICMDSALCCSERKNIYECIADDERKDWVILNDYDPYDM